MKEKNSENTKRARIIDVAFSEFSKKAFDKVSIFEIARKSKISRTDFYNYFNNKEQIYIILLDRLKDEYLHTKKNNKDIFECAKDFYDFLTSKKNKKEQYFIEKVFCNLNYVGNQKLFEDYFDTLNIDDEDCQIIKSMLFSSIIHLTINYFQNNISKMQTDIKFEELIKILKFGYINKEKNND